MKYTISNERFILSADTMGAELSSVKTKADGYEYIWQKCEIWQGQSPILFPVVGKLKDDELKLGNSVYTLPKHGFARKTEFEFDGNENELSFTLTESEKTLSMYPFRFRLNVKFGLTDKGYTAVHTVYNTDDKPILFSLGAHPGFCAQMGDAVLMDEPETASAFRLGKDGLIMKEVTPVFSSSQELVLCENTFDADALIFEGLNSKGCTVKKADGRNVHVDFGGAPCLGLWAKPGAPYVCVEPWYGLDDKTDSKWSFEDKKHVQSLEPDEKFVFTVTVELM